MGDIHDFYRQIESERVRTSPDPQLRHKRHMALQAAATFLTVLGYITAVLGIVVVIVIVASLESATGSARFSIVTGGLLTVGLYSAVMLAAGGMIRLLLDVQDNTLDAARMLHKLVEKRREPPDGGRRKV